MITGVFLLPIISNFTNLIFTAPSIPYTTAEPVNP